MTLVVTNCNTPCNAAAPLPLVGPPCQTCAEPATAPEPPVEGE